MDWIMGKIYTSIKGFVVITTAGSSIAIFTGLSSSLASYILGSTVGVAALFLAFDTFGMAQALDKLNKENDRLHQSNTDYVKLNLQHESNIKSMLAANTAYASNNKALSDQVDLLKGQTARFQTSIVNLNENNQMLLKNINTLQDQCDDFQNANNAFVEENKILHERLNKFKSLNDDFAATNQSLQTKITELSGFSEQQKRQIDSLRLVQVQSKQLIQALMAAGDDFKQFQSTLTDSMNRIENTSDALTLLLDKLQVNQFRAIDTNGDGSITHEELEAWSRAGKS
jgi:gas vesicle protein